MDDFQAIVVREADDVFEMGIETRHMSDLPDGEVVVQVLWSSLNYKDALSASGNRGVTRTYPHTPGIDAAGVVLSSTSTAFAAGDRVTVTGYDLGMNTPGGWGSRIRVPAGWVAPLPDGLTLEESMALGTAGLTAALSVDELSNHVRPEDGEILVTGATGGVGSFAVMMLERAGFSAVAATGKPEAGAEMLKRAGAKRIIERDEIDADAERPLSKARWAGVIDTVGGRVLAGALGGTAATGAVTACGNAASHVLETTVYPFILRGIRLIGIDCGSCAMDRRRTLWDLVAEDLKPRDLMAFVSRVSLEDLPERVETMLSGGSRGRVLVRVAEED